MKSFILTIGSSLLAISTMAQQGYTIDAHIKGQEQKKLSVAYVTGAGRVMDTAQIIGPDHFRFTGKVNEPVVAYLINSHPSARFEISKGGMFMPGPSLEFVLSNQAITITGSTEEAYLAMVKGDKINEELNKLKVKENPINKKSWELRKQSVLVHRAGDTVAHKKIQAEITALSETKKQLRKDFIAQHPASFISVYLMSQMYDDYSAVDYEKAYAKLASAYKGTTYAKIVAAKIESAKATALGRTAIDFSKKDINGGNFSLASLKGKYVLLDFWGSWCGPCRQSHPHLKTVYEKYKSKGLEIVGISDEKIAELDKAETAWKKAVEQDGIQWVHVLNNYGKADFDLVQKYGVAGFPTKFLLDKEGKILYKLVGAGEEGDAAIDAKLKEVFGE